MVHNDVITGIIICEYDEETDVMIYKRDIISVITGNKLLITMR